MDTGAELNNNVRESAGTPTSRPNTRSRTAATITTTESRRSTSCAEKRKRSPESQTSGNMSKKSTSDNEPSNALIMRTLTHMNAKFDELPTVEHLNRLEADLHNKLETSTRTLRQELRTEFRTEMQEQVSKMTDMITEVRSQVEATNALGRTNNQMGRYLRARRSFKVWPIQVDGPGEPKAEQAIRKFFCKYMSVPTRMAADAVFDVGRPSKEFENNSRIRGHLCGR